MNLPRIMTLPGTSRVRRPCFDVDLPWRAVNLAARQAYLLKIGFMQPKLTIVIPHLNRTAFLKEAIDQALDQSVPARILVSDQGHTTETADLMKTYADNKLVIHRQSPATCLHENWNYGYEAAMDDGALYVAVFQDDDIIHHRYAERINLAFDTFHDALTWTSRLNNAQDPELATWFMGIGPMVPLNLMKNKPRVFPGTIMVPYGYLTSWTLSPAVAFRVCNDFREALRAIPVGCDLYTERTILAEMGSRGSVVVDPVVIGYWRHHAKNESYNQNATSQPLQAKVFYDWMDRLMDRLGDSWQEILLEWAKFMPNMHLNGYLASLDCQDSRYAMGIAEVIRAGLKEEVTYDELRRKMVQTTNVAPLVI